MTRCSTLLGDWLNSIGSNVSKELSTEVEVLGKGESECCDSNSFVHCFLSKTYQLYQNLEAEIIFDIEERHETVSLCVGVGGSRREQQWVLIARSFPCCVFHREMVTILPERIVPGQLCNGDIMGA